MALLATDNRSLPLTGGDDASPFESEKPRASSGSAGASGGSCYQASRQATKRALEAPHSSNIGMVVQFCIVATTVSSTATVILETCPGMENHRWGFSVWEDTVTVFFTLEIMVRYWVSDSTQEYLSNCANIIDMIATAPGYMDWILASQNVDPFWRLRNRRLGAGWTMEMIRMLQIVRLMRILRLAKAARHSELVSTVMVSFSASLHGLGALVIFVGSSAVLSATVVFYTEAVDTDTKFVSIPAAIWWSLATITGVGYGDMVPYTMAGKAAGAVTMIGGVLAISMSVAIITTAFMEEYRKSLALVKIERLKARRAAAAGLNPATNSPPQGVEMKRGGTVDFQMLPQAFNRSAWLPEGRGSFLIEVEENNLLTTLLTLEESTKEVLMRLEASILRMDAAAEAPMPNPSVHGPVPNLMLQSGRHSFSTPSLRKAAQQSINPTVGMKTALNFLREQNSAWFKHASQLAESVMENEPFEGAPSETEE